MGIGRILLSPQHFFHTPNLLQLPLNPPPYCPPTHVHLHTSPRGCFVHHWNVHVELCVRPPPNPVTNHNACVTCHTRHTYVTDFRPKSGNPVEVTLMTSPKTVYSFPC